MKAHQPAPSAACSWCRTGRAINAKTAAARASAVENRHQVEVHHTMSALSSGSGLAARLAPEKPKARGFLHIVRHGGGSSAIYVVTYHRLASGLDRIGAHPKPVLAEGAHAL